MIKVLIVDDSRVESELLSYILRSDPEINVIGAVSTGEDAISAIARELPDIVTMDINMPGIDGFETTRRIMEKNPVPIIIISASYNKDNVNLSFKALEAGALTIIEKPAGPENPDFKKKRDELINFVKLMSEIKVVRRKSVKPATDSGMFSGDKIFLQNKVDVIAVGASTGGPQALQKLLQQFNGHLTVPVMLVQHITNGFTAGFAEWLSDTCSLNVVIPVHGERILPGKVYVAPDDMHMGADSSGCIILSSAPVIKNLRPAVSFLFHSIADIYGPRAIGILLTGMGRDGADELKLMRDKGALTFAQNEESSVVFGMPYEAIKLGGAVCVLPPEEIARKILEILNNK